MDIRDDVGRLAGIFDVAGAVHRRGQSIADIELDMAGAVDHDRRRLDRQGREVGVAAHILQTLRMPDGTTTLLVHGARNVAGEGVLE